MGFVDSVKDIAGKFGESVERGAKSVSNSSKKFAEKTRLKREISHIESDIDTDYIELGKAMYEKVCDDTDSEFAVTIADIKSSRPIKIDKVNNICKIKQKNLPGIKTSCILNIFIF